MLPTTSIPILHAERKRSRKKIIIGEIEIKVLGMRMTAEGETPNITNIIRKTKIRLENKNLTRFFCLMLELYIAWRFLTRI